MKFIISFFILFPIFTVSDSILAQNSPSANRINISDGKVGRYTREHWRSIIDSTWGEGLPTSTKLEIFDTFWDTIDKEFAGFQHLDIDWDSLKAIYRLEVDSGVSRGRFSGIMNYLT